MKVFLDRYPDIKNILNQLVTEMGLSMNVAIYALLKIPGTKDILTIIVFLFEKDEDTALMQHEYIGHETHNFDKFQPQE